MTTTTPAPALGHRRHRHATTTAIGATTTAPHRGGRAANRTAAYTAALHAGRTALLRGELDTLTVVINNQTEALYTPARDHHGHLDPTQLTTALIDLHHAATAGELAEQLTATPD